MAQRIHWAMPGAGAEIPGPAKPMAMAGPTEEAITREEYTKLQAQVGWELANTIVGLKFGYSDEARIAMAKMLLPTKEREQFEALVD